MATKSDVINLAHRRLAVASADEEVTADQFVYAEDVLTGLFAELQSVHETAFPWTLDDVPEVAKLALSDVLAAEIAPHYTVQPPMSRARAVLRLRAVAFPDDRPDSRDLDGDGVVTEAEEASGKRAAFY